MEKAGFTPAFFVFVYRGHPGAARQNQGLLDE